MKSMILLPGGHSRVVLRLMYLYGRKQGKIGLFDKISAAYFGLSEVLSEQDKPLRFQLRNTAL